jgi:hypothetical protein
VAVRQQEIRVHDVVAGDPQIFGQLHQHPDPPAMPKLSRPFVGRPSTLDDLVEEGEGLRVLKRLVLPPDDAQDRTGSFPLLVFPCERRFLPVVLADNREAISNRKRLILPAHRQRDLCDLPIQAGRCYRVCCGRRTLRYGATL